MIKLFKDLYAYRELLKSNIKKEIRGKYKGSFLGILWSFVNPLLSVFVFVIVFSIILKINQPHYVTFLICALIPWTYFTTSLGQGTGCIVNNSGIIKKVYFPREILPISVVTSGLVNFLISAIIIIIFLICSGIGFSINFVYLPIVILAQYLFTLGFLFITCSLNVFIRDTEYVINFIVMMLFYVTPILYNLETFAGTNFEPVIKYNPLSQIINGYRDIFYFKRMPDLSSLGIVLAISLGLVIIGQFIFNKLEKRFAEAV